MFDSDGIKGSFFLAILLDTMDHIIDKLGIGNIATFPAIEPPVLKSLVKGPVRNCLSWTGGQN